MQIINDVQKKVEGFVSENATMILTAGGVVGAVATAVLAGRAGIKAQQIIQEHELIASINKSHHELETEGTPSMEDVKLSKTEKFKLAGPHFIPPVLVCSATVGSIIFANRMSAQKAAALAAAYGLSQKQFEEYREKISEKLTGPKQDQVNTELAQERAYRAPGSGQFIIVEGGDVLCFDEPTGRYFKSSMEKINRAVNKTNEEIIHTDGVSANEFYDQLGLPPTTWGDAVGFNSDNLLELDIKAILSPEDERTPCLSIDFKRMPTADYTRRNY